MGRGYDGFYDIKNTGICDIHCHWVNGTNSPDPAITTHLPTGEYYQCLMLDGKYYLPKGSFPHIMCAKMDQIIMTRLTILARSHMFWWILLFACLSILGML